METNKRLAELIEKYKAGTLSEKEIIQLTDLLNNSNYNPDEEKYYKHLWDESNSEDIKLNSDRIWLTIRNKIQINPNSHSSKKAYRKLYLNLLSYAAVILIMLLSSWYYFNYISPTIDTSTLSSAVKEYIVPYGSKSKLLLSDGTQIWLNSGSKLFFDNYYNKKNRTVYLQGEAFFDVTENKEKPFYVKTNNIDIKVFGTSFNVKAFKEDETIETTLISGSVMLEKKDEYGNVIHTVQMKPNQIASYSLKKEKIVLTSTAYCPNEFHNPEHSKTNKSEEYISENISPEAKMAIAWKDNLLSFKGETIENLILKLQRWYDVEIILQNESLKNCRFTGAFDNETIEQALEALKLIAPFSYSIHENKIVIK